jgi:hypothetical protein
MARDRCTISRLGLFRHLLHAWRATISLAVIYLILVTSLPAQERVRSAAPPLAIESFKRSPEAFFYFGPFQEILDGSVGVQYTDNVNLAATDKISDLSFTQQLSLNTTWVISHLNKLQFNLGGELMENFYGNGRRQTTFAIDPNSIIELKFDISDFRVRLYDQISYAQNPTTDPVATNTANLNSFTNTIGAVVDKDFSLAVLSLTADYTYNTQSGQNVQGTENNPTTQGTRETFRVGSNLTFRLNPTILYGINTVATRSTGQNTANVNSFNFGPFINGKLNRSLEFELSGGLSVVETTPSVPLGYYFSAAFRYPINRYLQVLASGSHDLVFTNGTNLTEETVFRAGTQMNLTRRISFSITPFVNFGDVKTASAGSGSTTGPYTQLGLSASLAWQPRRRWTTTLSYDYVRRESSGSLQAGATSDNYIQNTLSLQIGYTF